MTGTDLTRRFILLMTGSLPTKDNLDMFSSYLVGHRDLRTVCKPDPFLPGKNIMNMLARSCSGEYTRMTMRKIIPTLTFSGSPSIWFPSSRLLPPIFISASGIPINANLWIFRHPDPALSTAENFLYMLRGEGYSKLEADIPDLSMVLHAEHGAETIPPLQQG